MGRINKPPPGSTSPAKSSPTSASPTKPSAEKTPSSTPAGSPYHTDLVQRLRAASAAPEASSKLSQFKDETLLAIVRDFAQFLIQNPHAEARKRAREFARATLKKKRRKGGHFYDILDAEIEADPRSYEELLEAIAQQIENSPDLSVLMEETERGALKIGS